MAERGLRKSRYFEIFNSGATQELFLDIPDWCSRITYHCTTGSASILFTSVNGFLIQEIANYVDPVNSQFIVRAQHNGGTTASGLVEICAAMIVVRIDTDANVSDCRLTIHFSE